MKISEIGHRLRLWVVGASLLVACGASIAQTDLLSINTYPRFKKAWESNEFSATNMRLQLQLERFMESLDLLDKKQKLLTDRCLGADAEKMLLRRQGKAIVIWPERFNECEDAWRILIDHFGLRAIFVGGLNSQLGTSYPVPMGNPSFTKAWETLKAGLTLFPPHCTEGSHRIWTSAAYPNAESPKSIYARLKSSCPREWVEFYAPLEAMQDAGDGAKDGRSQGKPGMQATGAAKDPADRSTRCDSSLASSGQVSGAGPNCDGKASGSEAGSGQRRDQQGVALPDAQPNANPPRDSNRDGDTPTPSDSGRPAGAPEGGHSNSKREPGQGSLDDELGAIGMPRRGSARDALPGQLARGQLILQQHIQRGADVESDLLRAAASQEALADQHRAAADRAAALMVAAKRAQDCLTHTRARQQAAVAASGGSGAGGNSATYSAPMGAGTSVRSGNPNAISNPRTSFPFLRGDGGSTTREADPCAETGSDFLASTGAGGSTGSGSTHSFEAVVRESGAAASGCDDAAQERREQIWFAPRQAQVMKFDGTTRYTCEVLKLAAEHLNIQIAYAGRCYPNRVSALRQELQLREREQRQHCSR